MIDVGACVCLVKHHHVSLYLVGVCVGIPASGMTHLSCVMIAYSQVCDASSLLDGCLWLAFSRVCVRFISLVVVYCLFVNVAVGNGILLTLLVSFN